MAPSATITTEEYQPISFSLEPDACCKPAVDTNGVSIRPKSNAIGKALKERIRLVDHDTCEDGEDDAFFVADLGEVYRQHLRWKLNLPRVKPHYAVKCNPDPEVLRLLAALGIGFDCASKAEIEQVLGAGVDASRIIYAQPCKSSSFVRYAAKHDVRQMTFDNAEELYKIKRLYPEAELFLRILTDDSASLCRLSLKFGASLDSTKSLLQLAWQLGLNVVGVAFHVGSGASDPKAFVKAVQDARHVFDEAADIGYDFRVLDVGGGFCKDTFEQMAAVLSRALDDYFPPYINVIGEPGRYYVASAFTIACTVIARRAVVDEQTGGTSYMLYLNDGVYGNFSSIMFDHQHPIPQVLSSGGRFWYEQEDCSIQDNGRIEYSVWGPTCDGIDCIAEHCTLPDTLDVGDWLYFENMGAYTKCSATRFNGFTNKHDTMYISTEPGASVLLDAQW